MKIKSVEIFRHDLPVKGGPYKMAKHALLGMTRSLAAENGPDGIRVLAAGGRLGRRRGGQV